MELRIGDKIHLNGYPDTRGKIVEIRLRGLFGKSYTIKWNDKDESRNSAETLCWCDDRHCERE